MLSKPLQIRFLEKRRYTIYLSIFLVLSTFLSVLLHGGLNYGIDFRGGTNVQIRFDSDPDLNQLRELFANQGYDSIMLQTFGAREDREILLGLPIDSSLGTGESLTTNLQQILQNANTNPEIRRVETIGPKVGDELKEDALLAVLIALGLVLIYISIRFQWRFGISAVVCLLHDVLAVVGVFSLFDKEFNLTIIAALLTVVGYSLNDTIVVFDRVRENLAKFRKRETEDLLDLSINETLSRTLLTSATTLFVVTMLLLFGGEIIHDFAFALFVGILVGTYSSIYVASPIFLLLQEKAPPKPAAPSTTELTQESQ
ncbi:MAG: protein translocase subunit SecF [SAR324 cluster bacterium]|nr:protein translocase subunit SecF [SAR324 cluster bacterium]